MHGELDRGGLPYKGPAAVDRMDVGRRGILPAKDGQERARAVHP